MLVTGYVNESAMSTLKEAYSAGTALFIVAMVAFPAATAIAQSAGAYPLKPIKIISPFAPGGANDIIARIVGQKLNEQWGQPVIIENRGGASGTIGVEACARAPADGYTIVLGGNSNLALAPHLYPKLPYDPLRDLVPIVSAAVTPYMLAINPNVPARNVAELVRLARSRRDLLSYGSSGAGSMSHLGGELFKAATGAGLVHIPYKGTAPSLSGMISGEVDMMIADVLIVEPHAKSGKLRLLAATGVRRSNVFPQSPTMIEAGLKDYVVEGKFGFVAPAGTPKDIVNKLNAGIIAALKAPDVKRRFDQLGYEAIGDTPEQYAAALKADHELLGRIVRKAGIKADL